MLSSEHTTALFLKDLDTPAQTSEQCALYVEEPLTDIDMAKLALEGITIHDTYVPPVPGKHPYGFYLATVDYSSLDFIREDQRFVRLDSTEFQCQMMNDKSAQQTRSDKLHLGEGTIIKTGAGVKIAIADSGLDVLHEDIPIPEEAYDMTDGLSI